MFENNELQEFQKSSEYQENYQAMLPFLKDDIYIGKIEAIRFYKTKKFEGIEFSTEAALLIEEDNDMFASHFRYEEHQDGLICIVVAEEEPDVEGYYVFEDVSHLFDIDAIVAECRKQIVEGNVSDETAEYLAFAAVEDTNFLSSE